MNRKRKTPSKIEICFKQLNETKIPILNVKLFYTSYSRYINILVMNQNTVENKETSVLAKI